MASPNPNAQLRSPVGAALARCRPHLVTATVFSALSNLLYLAPSLFMLQVYDRVLPSRGLATLAALGVITLAALAALGAFEWLRSRVLVRASVQLERELAEPVLRSAIGRPEFSRLDRSEAIRQVETLRQGIASPAMVAAMDAPWTPIYIVVASLLHPALGVTITLACIVLLILAWTNEKATAEPMKRAAEASSVAHARQAHASANAAEVRALGMVSALTRRQIDERGVSNALQLAASFSGNVHGSTIKFLRLALQSGALALGAVLVVRDAISPGSMIAASLLMTRALAPVEQIVGAWKTIIQGRTAIAKLNGLLAGGGPVEHTRLPAPRGVIRAEHVGVLAPGSDRPILTDIDFETAAAEVIGIVGASGAGKSTLLRVLSGATLPAHGHVRFDGASRADWDAEVLARHTGYLPQNFVLFPGTVKENIARFATGPGTDAGEVDAAVIAAARAIDAHDMIVGLPQGYDTLVGTGGTGLSGGQMQRIAIARALYGDPSIYFLDEPTAHLDADAQHAFVRLLAQLRRRGATVLIATHSADLLAATDRLLVLDKGRVARFGPIAAAPAQEARPPANFSLSPVTFTSWNARS